MELRKIEYKDAEEANCILEVATERDSIISLKQDNFNKKLLPLIDHATLLIRQMLDQYFEYFSITVKRPKERGAEIFKLAVAFDSNMKGYESRVTVKDIVFMRPEIIKERISALEKQLSEIDISSNEGAAEATGTIVVLDNCKKMLEIVRAINAIEEEIGENWHIIAEAETKQTKLPL